MKNGFIEIYDNALPDDICNYLISIFDREDNMNFASQVEDVRTMLDPSEGDTHYVSAKHMTLNPENYMYDGIIGDLDYVMKQKIFDYNNKYHVWSSKLNMNLIPNEEEKKIVEEEAKSIEYINNIIYRHGNYHIKKYTPPNDGFHIWHTDWGPLPEFIGRVLSVQFFLNDVEKGGETEFYHQGIKVKPKKGRLAIWPVGFTHTHRGNKPISNDKYVISTWATQKNLFR